MPLPPAEKNCSRFYPKATLKYTLVARGAGPADRERFSIRVR